MHVYDNRTMHGMLQRAGFTDITVTIKQMDQPLQMIDARRDAI